MFMILLRGMWSSKQHLSQKASLSSAVWTGKRNRGAKWRKQQCRNAWVQTACIVPNTLGAPRRRCDQQILRDIHVALLSTEIVATINIPFV
jgi:hypothetical protein